MWATILKILASVVAYFSNKQLLDAGRAEEKNNVHEATAKAVDAVQEIKRDVDTLSPSDVDKQLQQYFRD